MRKLLALWKKEFLQVARDPSSILIAVVIPFILLFFFGYAVSLDTTQVKLCVVDFSRSPASRSLLHHFNSPAFSTKEVALREGENSLVGGTAHGLLIIPQDFEERLANRRFPLAFLAVRGTEPNTAQLVKNYVQRNFLIWWKENAEERAAPFPRGTPLPVVRVWYNPEAKTRHPLLIGSIAVIMTLIGTILTSLVVAREWERNTVEALFSASITKIQFLLGKFLPYFFLGLLAMFVVSGASIYVFKVPLRGSVWWLLALSVSFLLYSLGLGFLISTVAKNQFLATLAALIVGFLPAFILSGLVFEIDSMPPPIRFLTYFFAPRYFVFSLRTLFLAGNVKEVLLPSFVLMLLLAIPWWVGVLMKTPTSLEKS